jgi:hypothetical protein
VDIAKLNKFSSIFKRAVFAWTGLGCDVCGYGTVENELDPTKPCPECGTIMLVNTSK